MDTTSVCLFYPMFALWQITNCCKHQRTHLIIVANVYKIDTSIRYINQHYYDTMARDSCIKQYRKAPTVTVPDL